MSNEIAKQRAESVIKETLLAIDFLEVDNTEVALEHIYTAQSSLTALRYAVFNKTRINKLIK